MKEIKHPEIQEGEVFLTNADLDNFKEIGWKTKRLGKVTFNIYGKRFRSESFFPVFVQRKELEEVGITIS